MDEQVMIAEMAERLKGARAVRIYFHKSPDGDAVGASHALALGLQSLDIKCETVCPDEVPKQFRSLADKVPQQHEDEATLIAVDSSAPSRLGRYSDLVFDYCIDHHENNSVNARCKLVKEDSSSCSELILRILEAMGVEITPQIADFLYVGLVTDTSAFRSVGTNEVSLRAAADLAAYGADIVGLGRRFCLRKNRAQLAIEGVLMGSFRYSCGGKVLGCFYSFADLEKAGVKDSELQGLNAVADQVEGIELAVIVREANPGVCRVSVRANAPYDASAICAEFGGAGHADRAGCTIEGRPEDVLAKVEGACAKRIA